MKKFDKVTLDGFTESNMQDFIEDNNPIKLKEIKIYGCDFG